MSGLLPWVGAAAAVLAALVLLRRPARAAVRAVWRSALWLGVLTAAEQTGVLAALGLGANLANAAVLGVLGLPGFGLLLAAPWLLR